MEIDFHLFCEDAKEYDWPDEFDDEFIEAVLAYCQPIIFSFEIPKYHKFSKEIYEYDPSYIEKIFWKVAKHQKFEVGS